MKPKTAILILVAVGGGLVASFMTSRYLANRQPQEEVKNEEEEKVTVLVAKEKLPGYISLRDPKLFEEKTISKSQAEVLKDPVDNFDKIKGRTLKNSLAAGKTLTESDLLPPNVEALEHKLKPGERAFTVKVTPDSAVAGFILPGSMVDVIATQTNRHDNQEPYSKTILQNVEVLAIDANLQAPDGAIAKTAERVTLRLTLKQCEDIRVHADTGNLCLVLRRPDDHDIVETTGATTGASKKRPAEPGGIPWWNPGKYEPGKGLVGPHVPDEPEKPKDPAKANGYTLTVISGTRIEKHQMQSPAQ
jgi:pilus assembly protein CpaB